MSFIALLLIVFFKNISVKTKNNIKLKEIESTHSFGSHILALAGRISASQIRVPGFDSLLQLPDNTDAKRQQQ